MNELAEAIKKAIIELTGRLLKTGSKNVQGVEQGSAVSALRSQP